MLIFLNGSWDHVCGYKTDDVFCRNLSSTHSNVIIEYLPYKLENFTTAGDGEQDSNSKFVVCEESSSRQWAEIRDWWTVLKPNGDARYLNNVINPISIGQFDVKSTQLMEEKALVIFMEKTENDQIWSYAVGVGQRRYAICVCECVFTCMDVHVCVCV